LDKKYAIKSNSSTTLNGFINKSLSSLTLSSGNKFGISVVDEEGGDPSGDRCLARYLACMGVATASGAGAHIACLSVDIGTLGVGAILCHGAAALLQFSMGQLCSYDYADCKKPAE